MSFAEAFGARSPDAYERLILDVIRGNQTLFMRRDEVEAAWAWIDPIAAAWEQFARGAEALRRRHLGPVGLDRADRARRPHLARRRRPNPASSSRRAADPIASSLRMKGIGACIADCDGERRRPNRKEVTAMTIHARIGEVTERIARRSQIRALALSRAVAVGGWKAACAGSKLSCSNLAHGFAACGARRQGGARRRRDAEPRHHHRLQRHALGAPALRALPRHHQGRRRGRPAARRRSRAACRRCATASRRGRPAWSCRSSRATRSPWRRRSASRTTCSMPRSFSASATRSCRAC